MSQSIEVKTGQLGLVTDASDLDRIDAMSEAKNVVIDVANVKESRKGYDLYEPYHYINRDVNLADITSETTFVYATSATRVGNTATISVAPYTAGPTGSYIEIIEENNDTNSKWCGVYKTTSNGVSSFTIQIRSDATATPFRLKFRYLRGSADITTSVFADPKVLTGISENSGYMYGVWVDRNAKSYELKGFIEDFDTSRFKYFGDTSPSIQLPGGGLYPLWSTFAAKTCPKYFEAVNTALPSTMRFNDTFMFNTLYGVMGSRDAVSGADDFVGPSPARFLWTTKNYTNGGRTGIMKESNYDISTVAYCYTIQNRWNNTLNASVNDIVLEGAPSEPYIITSSLLVNFVNCLRSGTTATVTTDGAHGLSTGDYIVIDSVDGKSTDLWCGVYQITVTDASHFTFTVSSSASAGANNVRWSRWYDIDVMFTKLLCDYTNSHNVTYTIYRTPRTTVLKSIGATDPGIEFQLVFEGMLNNGNFSAVGGWNELKYTDKTADINLGIPLYTNTSGKPNFPPPNCAVMANWKNYALYGNCTVGPSKELSLLSLDNVVSGTTYIKIAGYTYVFGTDFPIATVGTPSQNLRDTVYALVRKVNNDHTNLRLQYSSGFNDMPGRFYIECYDPTVDSIIIQSNLQNDWSVDIWTGSGLTVPRNTFPNSIWRSELQQAGHVPLYNQIVVGSDNDEIFNIIPNSNVLVVVKARSVWQVAINNGAATAQPVLEKIGTIAPRTTVQLDGKVYTLTANGFSQIYPSLDLTVDAKINREVQKGIVKKNVFDVAWATVDPVRHEIILGLPVDDDDNITCRVFRLSTKTGMWSEITFDTNITATGGGFRTAEQKLYLGQMKTDGTRSRLVGRRNAEDRTDYKEEFGICTVTGVVDTKNVIVTMDTATNWHSVAPGWVFYQGGQKAIVTEVNGSTLTLDRDGTWWTTQARIEPPINVSLTLYPFTANNSGLLKQYSDARVIFKDNQVTKFTTNWKSDLDRAVSTVVVNPLAADKSFDEPDRLPMSAPVGIPMVKQQCSALSLNIQHAMAEQKFSMLEVDTNVDVTSTSVIR